LIPTAEKPVAHDDRPQADNLPDRVSSAIGINGCVIMILVLSGRLVRPCTRRLARAGLRPAEAG
jgi:hypothetical protein